MTSTRARVAVVGCEDYDEPRVTAAVAEAVELALGPGWEGRVKDPVLIKPNVLAARRPDDGVCTHPAVLEAAIRLMRGAGSRDIAVGDSSGGSGARPTATDRALEVSGLAEAARTAGARVISFDHEEAVGLPNPRGAGLELIPLSKPAVKAGWLVSVAKLKTHALTTITAAVKNTFGVVPGAAKREYHRRYPSIDEFADGLLDIVELLKPELHIVDAVVAMQGEGPSGGQLRKVGLILAGTDPVAIDAVLGAIVGLGPERVPTTRLGGERGLGVADLARIDIAGLPIQEVRVPGFRLPRVSAVARWAPRGLTRAAVSLIVTRPAFEPDRCTQCAICAKNCPVGALEVGKDYPVPKLDDERCISCFCCHELCPNQAVYIRWRHPLGRLLFARGRDRRGRDRRERDPGRTRAT